MKTVKVIVSLITNDNDFQLEQATAAEQTAQRLGVDVQILYAENDSITQSQQLLKIIQSTAKSDVDAIIVEPAGGTALPQVAHSATAAGIGWVLLNRDADYISLLCNKYKVPVFSISTDHEEIGRIQGRQFAAMLPRGGTVLYIQGPSTSPVATQRTMGLYDSKLHNIQIKLLKSATWTETSGYQAIASWLRLSTSRREQIDVVGGQNDNIAIGARKALQEQATEAEWERWSQIPFTGVDGLAKTGQAWVGSGLLTATVVVPPNTTPALEMLTRALRTGTQPPFSTLVRPTSFPDTQSLSGVRKGAGRN
jgi:ribose transport system substrate-binding protein